MNLFLGFTTSTTTTTKQPGARNSGGDETSKWSVAIGEPYKIESSEIGRLSKIIAVFFVFLNSV